MRSKRAADKPQESSPQTEGATKATNKRKRRNRQLEREYSTYILRVLRTVHKDVGVSSKAMAILNSFVLDISHRVGTEAATLCHYAKCGTLGSRDVLTAARLVLGGELGATAIQHGTAALRAYNNAVKASSE